MLNSSDLLATLLDDVRRRIGDSASLGERIWTDAELQGYLKDGYESLCHEVGLIWDMETVDDLPLPGNWNHTFESSFFASRRKSAYQGVVDLDSELWVRCARFEYNFSWERDYSFSPAATYSASSFPWERQYDTTLQCAGVIQLPDGVLQVERATWDQRRIQPVRSSELECFDSLYESSRSNVFAYSQDKDGLASFRKYHIPSAPASVLLTVGVRGCPTGLIDLDVIDADYMQLDEWPMLDLDNVAMWGEFESEPDDPLKTIPPDSWSSPSSAGFSDFEVVGTYGGLCRLPGYHPSHSVWGGASHIAPTVRNTAIEYRRTGRPMEQGFDRLDQPDYILVYIRHYACWQALRRRGPGQNPSLAAHYQARWLTGVERLNERRRRMQKQEVYVYGGGGNRHDRNANTALAQPGPDLNYGQMED